ncbi:hypothetical protein [Deinococcus sp.]|uniref:hypothetical protein n=1 Tax=Deinococcus sp. TaxID=47478 RepID=UPI003C7E3B3C
MSLPKLAAGVIASLLMSLIWYLASPKDAQPQSVAEIAALRTPISLTLASGQQVSGELQGADSLCADWSSALQAAPDTVVQLPDGRSVTGADVRALNVGKTALAGAAAMGTVSVCPPTLTVRAVGSPASGPGDLKDAASTAAAMKSALNSLTGP